jgi:hypothetical protein
MAAYVLTDWPVMQALTRAADRGVAIRIYLDGTQLAEREQAKVFNDLAESRKIRYAWLTSQSAANQSARQIPCREFAGNFSEFEPNQAKGVWPAGFTRSSVRFPCQRRGVRSSKPAEPMILCDPCDKIQSGDGCVANIGGFPAEPSAPGIEPLRRCRRIGEAR